MVGDLINFYSLALLVLLFGLEGFFPSQLATIGVKATVGGNRIGDAAL